MKWAKGPLEVAPLFLKTPKRIAALGLVYILAIMVYALIQRQARQVLAETKSEIPGNNKSFTNSPTTEVIFRLFEAIFTVRAAGRPSVTVTNLTTEQVRVLRLLENDVLDSPEVVTATPRIPGRGQRGYRSPDS